MPAAMDDGGDDDANGDSLDFNAAAWAPDNRSYGLFYLMVIRQGYMQNEPEKFAKPAEEVGTLKFMENRAINSFASSKPR